jgi:hypothetical protein
MISDFAVAMPAADEAGELAAETAQPLWQAGAWTAQAALAALRGEEAAVEDLATRAEQTSLPTGAVEALALVRYVRGLLALGEGRHAEAFAELRRLYEPGDPARNERISAGALGDLAEAAAHSGHRDHALAVLKPLELLADGAPEPGNFWSLDYARAQLADDEDAEARYLEVLARDLSP